MTFWLFSEQTITVICRINGSAKIVPVELLRNSVGRMEGEEETKAQLRPRREKEYPSSDMIGTGFLRFTV